MKVPISKPNLISKDIESINEPLHSGWLVQGPKTREFEEKWSNFINVKHSIAVTSCTSAMHLSLAAINFEPGDEVIVPALTWISTANVVEHCGGKVIFCDIDLDTFNIDLNHLINIVTKKTKVIFPVHLFGLSCEMSPLIEFANENNINLIEDAACGFGSRYFGKHVGTFGRTGCFSFHPRKAITTGEGGMITTNDDELAEKIRSLRDHGAKISDLQRHLGPKPYILSDHPYAGYNQRMTDLQGALGSSQMDRAQTIVNERKALAENYDNKLKHIDWLKTPMSPKNYEHGYQSYVCLFNSEKIGTNNLEKINEKRNLFMDKLLTKGISTRPGTHAVHMLHYYKEKYNILPQKYFNAYAAYFCSVALPLYNGMSEAEQNYVIDTINDI